MTTSRRKFIQTLSLATAGALVSKSLYPFSNDPQPLRLGIIGTGDRGQGMSQLINEISGMEVTALCDILPFRLEKARARVGEKTKACADYRALLDDPAVDAVLIATPFSMHAQMFSDALDAGKHVYCEKTMCYGVEPTLAALKKARASKKIVQAGHQYRYSKLYQTVAQSIREGLIGPLSRIECQWNRNGNWRRPVPDPKLERLINWRMYREYSGGLVAELCAHQIDFANWILDAAPTKITGFGGIDYWKDGRETYDNVHLLMDYPGGVKASFTSLTTNAYDHYRIKVMGKKGTIVLTPEQAWLYSEANTPPADTNLLVDGVSGATRTRGGEPAGRRFDIEHTDPSIQALMDFRDNVAANTLPVSGVETGARVAIAVQLALDAMDHNRVEVWKEEYNF
ncbi:MAG: Gfo/Idh/MocA family oxidoreductase [Saprospiraceae bacterium]